MTENCLRCTGSGTVFVTTYGGHEVDCGMCGGTGRASIERGRRTAETMMDRAEAAWCHEHGVPHLSETCEECAVEAYAARLAAIGAAFARAAEVLEEHRLALSAAPTAARPNTGPPVPRQRRPRDHPTNTGIAARSRATSLSNRNALRRV